MKREQNEAERTQAGKQIVNTKINIEMRINIVVFKYCHFNVSYPPSPPVTCQSVCVTLHAQVSC